MTHGPSLAALQASPMRAISRNSAKKEETQVLSRSRNIIGVGAQRRGRVQKELAKVRATGPGGGVLDKPDTAFPKFDLDKDVRTRRKKPPRYQVMLHNDEVNRREYVVKVLLKIVPTLTMDDAVNIMNEAHFNGMAAVIVCAQEEAEDYCEGLRNNGLISTIEPVGPSD